MCTPATAKAVKVHLEADVLADIYDGLGGAWTGTCESEASTAREPISSVTWMHIATNPLSFAWYAEMLLEMGDYQIPNALGWQLRIPNDSSNWRRGRDQERLAGKAWKRSGEP